jgi:hypothetical protein
MTVDNIYDEIEFLTETDSTVFTDADKLRGLNLDQGEALQLMLYSQGYRKVGEKTYYTDFKTITGLTEGQNGYDGEYAFDGNWVKPIEFYAKFPGQNTYRKCHLYDVSENDNSEFDNGIINSTFSTANPSVRFSRNSFRIRPINSTLDVTDGIMVIAEPRSATLLNTTDVPVLDPIFHRWFVLKEALRFGKFRTGITRSDVMLELQQLEQKIRRLYSDRVKTPTRLKVGNESFK